MALAAENIFHRRIIHDAALRAEMESVRAYLGLPFHFITAFCFQQQKMVLLIQNTNFVENCRRK